MEMLIVIIIMLISVLDVGIVLCSKTPLINNEAATRHRIKGNGTNVESETSPDGAVNPWGLRDGTCCPFRFLGRPSLNELIY